MENMEQIIKDCMIQYSGAVLQSRALVDVRDCLKPSARQIFYCMHTDKFTSDKPFKKTLKAVGSSARLFIHGDSSAIGIIMRAAQNFSMRYPIIDVEGSEGNLTESGNWSAPRYTASRLSELSNYLFQDIKKDTIFEWRDNYDDTEKYPTVLPSKGYYNICNGSFGIAIGSSASIPQFNLKEVNNALIKLLQNPNISDDEIICIPDFCTGALLLNESEVRQSLMNGIGESCKLRSVIKWDEKERCLIVTEIPYSVYTNTICSQLEEILNDDENNPGIERFLDLTGTEPLIKIYLTKKANYKQVLEYLYSKTSLQYYYGINMVMLDQGRFPKLFTWKEALQAHIDHEKIVYRKGFEYDLRKIENRIHIIDGLLICTARIDEVISVIKNSDSPSTANLNLQHNFLLDEEQAKAVLAIKLASLAKLEVKKLQDEKIKLTQEAEELRIILNNEEKFNQQLINGWNEVSKKFGDARRTKILDLPNEQEIEDVPHNIDFYINIYSDYLVQNSAKNKLTKFKKGKVTHSMSGTTMDIFYAFTNLGKVYSLTSKKLGESGKIKDVLPLEKDENIISIYNPSNCTYNIVYCITKLGLIKKIEMEECLPKKNGSYITLQEHDSVISVLFGEGNEKVTTITKDGLIIVFDASIITPTKRPSKGILAMKLKTLTDEIADAALVTNDTIHICTITDEGFIKKTIIEEYPDTARGTKGRIAHKLNEDRILEVHTISKYDTEICSPNFGIIEVDDIPEMNRVSRGISLLK